MKPCPKPPAIDATFVPAESIPQPQHDLLVHFSDMTSTLTAALRRADAR